MTSQYTDPLIFGKDLTEKIVSIEIDDGEMELFIQQPDGSIKSEFRTNKYWLLSDEKINNSWMRLQGDLHYKFGRQFESFKDFKSAKAKLKHYHDIYTIHDIRENALVNKGITYYKGMNYKDVSILSFDIETTGIKHDSTSKLLIIANTFRNSKGVVSRKLFTYDQYDDEGAMIRHWVNWVRKLDPSVLVAHNGLTFDLPYIKFIADKYNVSLDLGRDGSRLKFNPYPSKKRISGSRTQEYFNVRCYGREIFDSYFAAISWDVKVEMESYALKSLIKQLGLEVENRQHYDAATIGKNYKIPEEWEKIKSYATFDGDDALAIYDKIGSTFFYSTQNIPKPFQQVCLSASGSQINSMLVRSYLQTGHSIPKAYELTEKVEGGISFGVPGIYRNVLKVDLKSAYPSQILRFRLFDEKKDPKGHFLAITRFFTEKRLQLKELLINSNDIYLKAQDDTAKVFINSMYGLLNTAGLNFNAPKLAAKITFETRLMIKNSIKWASNNDFSEYEKYMKKEMDQGEEELEEEAS